MWRRRARETVAVAVLAAAVTVVIAASALRAPTERLFGRPIVGRHYDAFAVMTQMRAPVSAALYLQPVTDVPAAFASRLIGPVAAFNWIVLVSFPLSAIAAFLLARYLGLSRIAAVLAAMAYAFSPFHIAHAAYHAHIAQTQWLPLYLLALLHCLDRGTRQAAFFLAGATLAVSLSNYYGGLIAAVITPFAIAGHWWSNRDTHTAGAARTAIVTLGLVALAVAGYAFTTALRIAVHPVELAYARTDLFRYGAKWWSYLVPPVEHPFLGNTALRIWDAAGVREGLLEQQIAVGFGIGVLAIVGATGWWRHDRSRSAAYVPMLAIIAVVSFAFSLAPERVPGMTIRPAAWAYELAPMFRSYARFGLAVQLAAVLLAGIGVDRLRRIRTRRAGVACTMLVVLAIGEYTVRPSAMSHDVLPTLAHRWVLDRYPQARVLDCAPQTLESESVEWLTSGRVTLAGTAIENCAGPLLPQRLAAHGFTHLIERSPFGVVRVSDGGLVTEAAFGDGRVYAVTARAPALFTSVTTGFRQREGDDLNSVWRWMSNEATMIVVNTAGAPLQATLRLELSAFRHAGGLELWIDGDWFSTLQVEHAPRVHEVGPIRVLPGARTVMFRAVDAPVAAAVSFGLGAAEWRVAP
jgi:hypothetical protein